MTSSSCSLGNATPPLVGSGADTGSDNGSNTIAASIDY
jgi:hypothetical protein